jgi:hypothetical protein
MKNLLLIVTALLLTATLAHTEATGNGHLPPGRHGQCAAQFAPRCCVGPVAETTGFGQRRGLFTSAARGLELPNLIVPSPASGERGQRVVPTFPPQPPNRPGR